MTDTVQVPLDLVKDVLDFVRNPNPTHTQADAITARLAALLPKPDRAREVAEALVGIAEVACVSDPEERRKLYAYQAILAAEFGALMQEVERTGDKDQANG